MEGLEKRDHYAGELGFGGSMEWRAGKDMFWRFEGRLIAAGADVSSSSVLGADRWTA